MEAAFPAPPPRDTSSASRRIHKRRRGTGRRRIHEASDVSGKNGAVAMEKSWFTKFTSFCLWVNGCKWWFIGVFFNGYYMLLLSHWWCSPWKMVVIMVYKSYQYQNVDFSIKDGAFSYGCRPHEARIYSKDRVPEGMFYYQNRDSFITLKRWFEATRTIHSFSVGTCNFRRLLERWCSTYGMFQSTWYKFSQIQLEYVRIMWLNCIDLWNAPILKKKTTYPRNAKCLRKSLYLEGTKHGVLQIFQWADSLSVLPISQVSFQSVFVVIMMCFHYWCDYYGHWSLLLQCIVFISNCYEAAGWWYLRLAFAAVIDIWEYGSGWTWRVQMFCLFLMGASIHELPTTW